MLPPVSLGRYVRVARLSSHSSRRNIEAQPRAATAGGKNGSNILSAVAWDRRRDPGQELQDKAGPVRVVRPVCSSTQNAAGFAGIFDRVVAEIPQDLAQVARIHANFQVGHRAPRSTQFAFLQLERARENSCAKSFSQGAEVESFRCDLTSRRDNCSTLSMIWLTRSACVLMISVRRRSSSSAPLIRPATARHGSWRRPGCEFHARCWRSVGRGRPASTAGPVAFIRLASSRKTSTGPLCVHRPLPSGAKCALINAVSSSAFIVRSVCELELPVAARQVDVM